MYVLYVNYGKSIEKQGSLDQKAGPPPDHQKGLDSYLYYEVAPSIGC